MGEEIIVQNENSEQNENLAVQTANYTPGSLTMWNDKEMLRTAVGAAKYLAGSGLVPDSYRGSMENCLIALDISNRLDISPIMVMQNLYIVKGNPAWSGSFCAAAINGCGKFTPLEYVFVGDHGTMEYGCFARATRIKTGVQCVSDTITMQMAKNEGWIDKAGSKWKTMPKQMMMYRAASFFARAHCPDVLLGIQTVEEVKDVNGYEEKENKKTTVVLE